MSHRKTAPLPGPTPAKPKTGTSQKKSTSKEEILQIVQALTEKIQKDPEKSAKILTEWLNRGKF